MAARRTKAPTKAEVVILASFAGALEWEELPDKQACRVALYGEGDVLTDDEPARYIEWMFEGLRRFRAGFRTSRFATD